MAKHTSRALAALGILLCDPVMAGVGNISSPQVTEGEYEMEYKFRRYGDASGSPKNNNQGHELEIEYGFTDRLAAGISLQGERSSPNSFSAQGYGVEAQYEMTEQKDWWLASAVKGTYSRATDDGDADNVELQLLLARSDGDFRNVMNIDFGRDLGDNRATGISTATALKSYYRANRRVGPGFEWHAEWNTLNDLSADGDVVEQYIGPIVTGTLFETEKGAMGYTAGYYWGITGASADDAARIQLKYSAHF